MEIETIGMKLIKLMPIKTAISRSTIIELLVIFSSLYYLDTISQVCNRFQCPLGCRQAQCLSDFSPGNLSDPGHSIESGN
jgi:hypothetical protein